MEKEERDDVQPTQETKAAVALDNAVEKSVHWLMKNTHVTMLLAIILVGAVLRFLAVSHVAPLADEMIHGTHAIGIVKSGVINLQNQGPLWSYLTDIAYSIFGINGFGGRFLSFFFGTLTIPLVYLLGVQLFNRRIALLAAALLAISAFHIRYALMEMDEAMIFFVLFAYYAFVKELQEKKTLSLLACVSMGVAILIKPIALPFLPGFVLAYFALVPRAEQMNTARSNVKRAAMGLGILFLFVLPVLAFNYILYTQKGITDVLFARFFGIGQEIYASLEGYNQSFSLSYLLNNGLPSLFKDLFLPYDPLIFILGALGIALFFVQRGFSGGRALVLFHLVTLVFLLGTSLLPTHFVSFMPLLSLGAAAFMNRAAERLPSQRSRERAIAVALAFIVIINLVILFPVLSSTSAFFKMRSYAQESISEQDVIVADARIYRGRIAWMFNDRAYLEASQFGRLMELNANLSGAKKPTNVYFVECVYQDDCGWGTIASQPELNAGMEAMAAAFRNASQQEIVFKGGGGYSEDPDEPYFRMYKVVINLNPRVFPAIYDTHDWFYYPVRWAKPDWYDKYVPRGAFQILLHQGGKLMLWSSVFSALLISAVLVRACARSLLEKERASVQ